MTAVHQGPAIRVGVGAVVLAAHDGARPDVLLVRRGRPPKLGEWSLPGGHLELGERPEDAAQREIREETAIDASPLELIDAVTLIEHAADGRVARHYVLLDYLAMAEKTQPVAGDDAAEAAWFSQADALSMVGWSETRRILALAFERHRQSHSTSPAVSDA